MSAYIINSIFIYPFFCKIWKLVIVRKYKVITGSIAVLFVIFNIINNFK